MGEFVSQLEARVLETIRDRQLAHPGETVLVAVSGGADSIALLLLLSAVQKPLGIALVAAHYEHGIRGEASLADARHVRALCGRMGIPCQMGGGDVPALRRAWRCSMEDAARRARYAFLEETALQMGAARIALAHQLEDQAETLLLHLAHGSGVQGLCGMRHRQGMRIRPLLDIRRQALEAYLRARGESWREDATNRDTAYARNLLRHAVMPVLRQLNPQADEALARTALLLQQDADTLQAQARSLLAGRTKRMLYGAFWYLGDARPDAHALRMWAGDVGALTLDARQTAQAVGLRPGETANLPGGWRAFRTGERLHLLQDAIALPPVDRGAFAFEAALPGETGDGIRTQVLDAQGLCGAVFRRRMPGDVFAPLGGEGTQKLKKTLMDAGVDRPFRDLLPVLARGNRVLWVVGLKPSRDAAVTPHTQSAVRIVYHGDLPWEIFPDDKMED